MKLLDYVLDSIEEGKVPMLVWSSDEVNQLKYPYCSLQPRCSRIEGHDGPCARE